jgi:hypothetical protein
MRSTSRTARASSGNQQDYLEEFLGRVHQLLEAGYQAITIPKQFMLREEPDISGELARHIEDVLDVLDEDWKRFYSVANEAPEDQPHLPVQKRRFGKRRQRKDICLRCTLGTRVIRFVFEAKKLCQSNSFRDLLDEDGLGRLLTGQYARNDQAAGLLGYVTLGSPSQIASKLAAEFRATPDKYLVTVDGQWRSMKWKDGPQMSYITRHHRPKLRSTILVSHTLLAFC